MTTSNLQTKLVSAYHFKLFSKYPIQRDHGIATVYTPPDLLNFGKLTLPPVLGAYSIETINHSLKCQGNRMNLKGIKSRSNFDTSLAVRF